MTSSANAFHALHNGPGILLLPNAWDAMSAKLIETAGAKAIATSSAAVAWSHGYADGHHLPFELLVKTTHDIVRVVKLPVTADSEGGYAKNPNGVADNIRKLIDVGAVGINLEDGNEPHDVHLQKIAAVRAAANKSGINLFINARTDVYLKGLVSTENRLEETLNRAKRFKAAGASGVFVPGVTGPEDIKVLAREIDLPLNIMGWSGVPKASVLQGLGVRRLSAATNIARAAWAATNAATKAFLNDGDCDALTARGEPGANYNALFT